MTPEQAKKLAADIKRVMELQNGCKPDGVMDSQTLGHNLFMFKQEADNMASIIRQLTDIVRVQHEVLRDAPVYATKDGTWLNFRCDHKAKIGNAMIKVDGLEAEVLRNWGRRSEQALALAAPLMNAGNEKLKEGK